MASVVVCSLAEIDYVESLCWYAERSAEAANAFEAEFDRAIRAIAADPERFPNCDERHRFCLLQRFPFRIIYRTILDKVIVIAVAHSSRSPDYWSNRS